MDSNIRSIAKAVSYRLFGSLSTAGIFFFFSRNAALSLGVGGVEAVVKIALYFVHERLWNYVPFGRQKPPEYQI